MPEFNVLTEPWIKSATLDGKEREYGLLGILADAHLLRAVSDPSPPIQFGLYRLMITFVQDALRLVELEDLEDALAEGRFSVRHLEQYVERVGENRFDLFDTEKPFLQTPISGGDARNSKSIVELFYHLPTGTNVVHFFHMGEGDHAVSPAVAARALCSIAPFMTAGGAGYSPSINGSPPWYVLAVGDNLFQTLLLNCPVMAISGLGHKARPVWAADTAFTPRAEKDVDSLAEGFTWQPREVRLFPTDGGVCTYSGTESKVLIRRMAWGPGHKFGGQDRWFDPNVAYAYDEKRGRLPIRPREGREIWRDYGALFLLRRKETGEVRYSRPNIVDQLYELKSTGIVSRDQAELFEVYGMRVDKAKVFEWHYERMPVRSEILQNPQAGVQVQHALELAEGIASGLYGALKRQYPRDGGGNKKAHEGIIRGAQTRFWSQLYEYFESEYLSALASQAIDDEDARKALLEDWKSELRRIGWECFELASRSVETGAKALQRQVAARNSFAISVSKVLSEKAEKSRRKGG